MLPIGAAYEITEYASSSFFPVLPGSVMDVISETHTDESFTIDAIGAFRGFSSSRFLRAGAFAG